MEVEKIKRLLDLYYSGDITPDEYETLRAAMTEDDADHYPELDSDRAVFRALESVEAAVPDDLESRLIESIDRSAADKRNWIKEFIIGVAAAVAVVITGVAFVTGSRSDHSEMSGFIAETIVEEPDTLAIMAFSEFNELSDTIVTDEELERRFHVVDRALKSVLLEIRITPRQAVEQVNNINITQNINLNFSK